MNKDLFLRLFEFSRAIKVLVEVSSFSPENSKIRVRLLNIADSLGEHYEHEISGSSSPGPDFSEQIIYKEIRESTCWLRIIKRSVMDVNLSDLDYLIKESIELITVLDNIILD